MGNRANVYVRNSDDSGVYLYAHWSGSELPFIVQRALARNLRWDDDAYLTRIIFCQMIKESDDLDGELGFGISTRLCDNEHSIIVIDCDSQRIGFTSDDDDVNNLASSWTFSEYISLMPDEIEAAYK